MSQAQDMAAINDYFNRMPGKTTAAKDAKASWSAWYNGLSFFTKSFTEATLAEATKRRIAFDAANGEVKRLDDGGLTKEEQEYFAKLPSVNVTGMTPKDAKIAVAQAAKQGATIPVPATLIALQAGSLRQGSQGDAVKELQKVLGITPADGKYGPSTVAAVKKFQTTNKLKADGIVGPSTWAAIAKKKPSVTPALQKIIQKPFTQVQNFDLANAATPTTAPAIAPTVTASAQPATTPTGTTAAVTPSSSVPISQRPVLRKGMTGGWVSFWQRSIEAPVTSAFDAKTFNLTKAWQTSQGLVADGVVGSTTWAKLGASGVAVQAANEAARQVQTASMFGTGPMPTWAKWFLAVMGIGAFSYGIKYTKEQRTNPGSQY